jgi:hypothetical protein
MPEADAKTKVKMTLNIQLGPASLSRKQLWARLWQKLIAESKQDKVAK